MRVLDAKAALSATAPALKIRAGRDRRAMVKRRGDSLMTRYCTLYRIGYWCKLDAKSALGERLAKSERDRPSESRRRRRCPRE
jgi:hypothetical protein